MKGEKEDPSKNVLAVVLIIIIFVSILGTWTVLSAIDRVQMRQVTVAKVVEQGAPTTGQVMLEILPPKEKGEKRG